MLVEAGGARVVWQAASKKTRLLAWYAWAYGALKAPAYPRVLKPQAIPHSSGRVLIPVRASAHTSRWYVGGVAFGGLFDRLPLPRPAIPLRLARCAYGGGAFYSVYF